MCIGSQLSPLFPGPSAPRTPNAQGRKGLEGPRRSVASEAFRFRLCLYRSERGREANNLEEGPLPFWRVWGSKTLPKEHRKINRKNGLPKRGPWGAQGRPREAQESPMRPNRSQKGPKRLPKEVQKSTILGFGQETSENVKIALPCRRQLNFQGSGTLEKRHFRSFFGSN